MTKILEKVESPFNGKVEVVRMLGYGTILRAGNLTQSGGIIYDIWKKTMKKVQGDKVDVDNALIVGLGGGTLVKLIHKFWHDAKITGVDIDPIMVEMGKKHLGLKEGEAKIVIEDALLFCQRQFEKKITYDLIFVDTYNGDEFPKQFEDQKFLELIKKLLAPDGIAVFNRLYYDEKRKLAVKFSSELSKVFSSNEAVYPEANVMFVCTK